MSTIDELTNLLADELIASPNIKIKSVTTKTIGSKRVGVIESAEAIQGMVVLKRVYLWWDKNNNDLWGFIAETNKAAGFEDESKIEHFVESFTPLSSGESTTQVLTTTTPAKTDSHSNVVIYVDGDTGIKFTGSIFIVRSSSGTISKSVDGTTPAKYEFHDVSMVSVTFQKMTWGDEELKVTIVNPQTGEILASDSTTSSYGWVGLSAMI